jgi:putative radical SAM enzyme (TIGR03279 family)
MPPGLRKGLYIKDEDVKHSFINGNYVTLSSLTNIDLEKVVRLGISPLYVSVHVTDPVIRNQMLGNKKAPPVMPQLQFLSDHGIQLHTQIVLCPGFNDGDVLRNTIRDLRSLGDTLRSIAVVPVGITRFRKTPLQGVDTENARQICTMVGAISDKMTSSDGFRKLFCADELFIRAGLSIPSRRYYEEYPQIENGVGLIRMLCEDWKKCKRQLASRKLVQLRKKTFLIVTSVSAFSYINKIIKEAADVIPGLSVEVVPVINTFFGNSVTVAGLLTARDVIPVLKKYRGNFTYAILPSVMFNYAGSTLDGYSTERIGKESGVKVKTAEMMSDIFIDGEMWVKK